MVKHKKLTKEGRAELFLKNIILLSEIFEQQSRGLIVGIDPGRNSPGLAIYNPRLDKISLHSHKTKGEGFGKVIEVELWMRNFLDDKKIRLAIVEDYSFGEKFNRESMGEIGGVIRRYFWIRGIPLFAIAPQTLKSLIGVKKKELILKETFRQYKIDTESDDEADAFLLVKIGQLLYNSVNKFRAIANPENIKKIEAKPHEFCGLKVKEARIVKDAIIGKGAAAHGYAREGEKIRQEIRTKIKEKY
jgi:hypothetical protein